MRGGVERKIADCQRFAGQRRADAAHDRGDPGDQFARGKRLGQIVVRTGFKPANHVILGTARGQHDDGNMSRALIAAQAAAHFDAAGALDHPVEHHQIGRFLGGKQHGFVAVGGDDDAIALGAKAELKQFSSKEQRQIVFKHIDNDEVSHVTDMLDLGPPSPENVIGWFARAIKRDLRLVGGFDILFGKIKSFIETRLFDHSVSVDDANVLRNLSEPATSEILFKTLKKAINDLTIEDKGSSRISTSIKLSNTRAFTVQRRDFVTASKSIFNRVVGDNALENGFAGFLEKAPDVTSFVKNDQHTGFFVEYASPRGLIANYYPDFIAKASDATVWIIETKGQEDIDVEPKWQRLLTWCEDAIALDPNGVTYRGLFVDQDTWDRHAGQVRTLGEAASVFDRA